MHLPHNLCAVLPYKYCRQILFAREKIFVRRVSPRIASRLLFLLMCNLRVMRCRVIQGKRELFSFFASFFLFSKEKKKRNSL